MKPSAILRQELSQGRCVRLVVDHDGASMRGIINLGDVITLGPVVDVAEIRVGDLVYVRWKNGNYLGHQVGEISGDRFLIVNSSGKINGWVTGDDVLGKVQSIERTGRSDVAKLLEEQMLLGVAFYV